MRRPTTCVTLGVLLCGVMAASQAAAQEMEPRSYSASPVGLTVLVIGYSWVTGAVVLDPTLPISNVDADVQSLVVVVGRSFNLFGDLGLVTAVVPVSRAHVTGDVFEQQAEVRRAGLANALLKLSVNLRGNPAMTPAAFSAAPRRTIIGASLTAGVPVGQYDSTKLVNLGTNRW